MTRLNRREVVMENNSASYRRHRTLSGDENGMCVTIAKSEQIKAKMRHNRNKITDYASLSYDLNN